MKLPHRLYPFYDKLTLAERLGLSLAAYERRDVREILHIMDNCPDEDLVDYVTNVLHLGIVVSYTVIQLLARQFINTSMCYRCADQPGADPGLKNRLADSMVRQAAIWGGFVAWCRDHGHKPRRVLHLLPVPWDERDPACFVLQWTIECAESLSQASGGSIPDPELVQKYRHMFDDIFEYDLDDVAPVDEDGELL